ncbi:hypothetical protein OXX80_012079 [Metschnikowia pulcherrima]|uniref:Uncharacterized protein n=1 Tax=Metschnikowia aff. pulcherrima TaxID=2163413 RepID=A0A4P6XWH4_9ASCO|nr:hypothetical protein METSCH_F05560 [Metschnikowia aff. pulcherrima]
MQFSTVAAISALSASAMAAYSNATVVTEDVTVTGYTTYCPASTVVTITTCSEHKCAPHTVTVSEATTLTITEECVVPTTYTTESKTVTSHTSTKAPSSTTATVSSWEGAGAKNAAGVVAGVAAVAAALL